MHIEDAKALLRDLANTNISVFLWGGPGVGKSSLVKQLTEERSIGFKDVRLTTIDPTDLRGLPYIKDGEAIWASPALLPNKRDPEEGILLLDELNSAHQTIQAGAYQLVLDRRIGEYSLPPKWQVIGAGNREEDRGVFFNMPRPLSNRFIHIEIDVDKDVWINWAIDHGISPQVIAFIESNPSLLAPEVKSAEEKTKRAFPTPRSWEMASNIITNVKREDLQMIALGGTIGEAASHQLVSFLKLRHKLPNINKILAGSEEKLPSEPSIQYAFYAAFCGAIDDRVKDQGVAKLSKDDKFVSGIVYVVKNLSREFTELIMKYMSRRQGDLMLAIVRKNGAIVSEISNMFSEMVQVSRAFGGGK